MRERERGGGLRSCSKKGCDALLPGASQRIGQAFAASFPSLTPSSPRELTLPPLCTHTFTHVRAHRVSLEKRQLSPTKASPSHSPPLCFALTGPILSSVCLLYSLHNAGINFSKPIWAAARFGKERRAELLCWGKFPLHTSLEVDRAPLYSACFNLHTEQRERGGEDKKGRGLSTHSWESLMSLQRRRPLSHVPLWFLLPLPYLSGVSSSQTSGRVFVVFFSSCECLFHCRMCSLG